MIFEVDAEQISRLDSLALVQLMKRLLLAECQLIGVPLRGTTVPVQITVSDGGEDGRVEWQGGATDTDYLPSPFCIFQSKAQKLTPATVEAEVFTKASRARSKNSGSKPELNAAVSEALARGGSYVIFCSEPFTGQKKKNLIKAITDAITKAGATPSTLAHIAVYDANTIADWVNTHPGVALWLTSRERRRSLSGFQSHDGWGRAPDIHKVPWNDDDAPRFAPANHVIADAERKERRRNAWTFSQAADAALSQLARDTGVVRIVGPSGFGKSRFAFELFNRTSLADQVNTAAVIYADLPIVGQEVVKLALEIADAASPTILVVDDCPDDVHTKLADIANRSGSRLRLLTLDVETRVQQAPNTMVINLEPAQDGLISGIAQGIAPALPDADVRFILELSSGFPRMAVLAARQGGKRREAIVSIEQVIERIVWGQRPSNEGAQKALEILSLFDWVGFSGRVQEQVAYISRELAGIPEDSFVEYVKSFKQRGIVVERGDFVQVQPIPLAARLASRRLSIFPNGKFISFFLDAPRKLQESILRRLRWLDTSPVAVTFARRILDEKSVGNFPALNTSFGSECAYHLVHVDPDAVMIAIERSLGGRSLEELREFRHGRRYVVWALEKLAFRSKTFQRAATLLRRLGAAEIEDYIGNNATGQFKELYQLHLSGTEVGPDERLQVLDEGLRSADSAERALCVEALGRMLQTGHFSRVGGAEEIGSGDSLEDWTPSTNDDVWNFYRAAMNRLADLAISNDQYAKRARHLLGSHIRDLLNVVPFDEVRAMIQRVVAHTRTWIEAIQGVNSWLFFDRSNTSENYGNQVRRFFDELLPQDPVDLAMLYAYGWSTDLHDPDLNYDPKSSDFEYPVRELHKLAESIARDETLLDKALNRFVTSDAKSAAPFARRLAELTDDPGILFAKALQLAESRDEPADTRFFGGLINGAEARDPLYARDCVRMALASPKLRQNAVSMIGSGTLRPDDLRLVASLLQCHEIEPWQCAALSHGRGLDHFAPEQIVPLLDELQGHGVQGLFAALEIVVMYDYGGNPISDVLAGEVKRILLAPALFEDSPVQAMSAHHVEQAAKLLIQHGKMDRKFAVDLIKQLSTVYSRRRREVSSHLRGPAREIMISLIAVYPQEVWREVSKAFVSKDSLVRFNVEHLFEPGPRAHNGPGPSNNLAHTGPGPLHNLPSHIYLGWVRRAPASRAHIIIKWLPITTSQTDDTPAWHTELEAYIDEFGDQPRVLAELAKRLQPRTTWGSRVPYLEPLLPLLTSWEQGHNHSEVRRWAAQEIRFMNDEIAAARKRDEERGAGIY